MIKTGLVSVTFRKLDPEEIVRLTAKAGLEGIEWGGDIHVPHGDLAQAQKVRELTIGHGLEVAAYGSYYRLGESEEKGLSFESVLKTAEALGAPMIRTWAGSCGSAEASQQQRENCVKDAERIASMAADADIAVSLECHANTLTDTAESACTLMNEIAHSNMYMYWQPAIGASAADNLKNLKLLLGRVTNIHVFHWWPNAQDRRLLADGISNWLEYFKIVKADSRSRYALLEFVKDDDPEIFMQDAQTLKSLI